MPELVRQGKIFLAQPPLYQVTRNKKSQYVLNEREMNEVLTELALSNTVLITRDENDQERNRIDGDGLARLVRVLDRLQELVSIAERRGSPFTDLLAARDDDPTGAGRLPSHRLTWTGGETLCWNEEQARQFITDNELILDDLHGGDGANGDRAKLATLRELHENRELDRLFEQLAEAGLNIDDFALVQEESVTGEKLPTRYAWIVDPGTEKETVVDVPNIPSVLVKLHEIGRRGIEIKRFKGLGEMNPDELSDTTMDPDKRVLLRVTWDAASNADELFSVLMGENVENRRSYIEDHALEVKNLDV